MEGFSANLYPCLSQALINIFKCNEKCETKRARKTNNMNSKVQKCKASSTDYKIFND